MSPSEGATASARAVGLTGFGIGATNSVDAPAFAQRVTASIRVVAARANHIATCIPAAPAPRRVVASARSRVVARTICAACGRQDAPKHERRSN
jgi:hypothetical protein